MINLCRDETIKATKHFINRINERNIEYDDVLYVIKNGEMIEEYPTAYPYPCALFFKYITNNKPLHVLAGTEGSSLWLITAYNPSFDKWESDYKTRKADK